IGNGSVDVRTLISRPGTVLLAATTAVDLGIDVGQSFPVLINGVERNLTLAGLIGASRTGALQALDDLALMDIASAQEALGKVGRLDRIDLVAPGVDSQWLEGIRAALPPGVELIRASARSQSLDQLTRAFRLNLTALSLLALLVGVFLIYNT